MRNTITLRKEKQAKDTAHVISLNFISHGCGRCNTANCIYAQHWLIGYFSHYHILGRFIIAHASLIHQISVSPKCPTTSWWSKQCAEALVLHSWVVVAAAGFSCSPKHFILSCKLTQYLETKGFHVTIQFNIGKSNDNHHLQLKVISW